MFKCERSELARALDLTGRVTKSRSTNPACQLVLLTCTEDGRIVARATSGEQWAEFTTEDCRTEDQDEEIHVLVDHTRLLKVIREGSAELSLEQSGEMLVIRNGDSKVQLTTKPPEVMPEYPSGDCEQFAIDGGFLADLIFSVSWLPEKNAKDAGSGYSLSGVVVSADSGRWESVAFNGTSKMAVAKSKLETVDWLGEYRHKSESGRFRIPFDFIGTLKSAKLEGSVKILHWDSAIGFECDGIRIAVKKENGSIPKYRDILKRGTEAFSAKLDTESWVSSFKVLSALTDGFSVLADAEYSEELSSINASIKSECGSGSYAAAVEDAAGQFSGPVEVPFVLDSVSREGASRITATTSSGIPVMYKIRGETPTVEWLTASTFGVKKGES